MEKAESNLCLGLPEDVEQQILSNAQNGETYVIREMKIGEYICEFCGLLDAENTHMDGNNTRFCNYCNKPVKTA